MPIDFSEVDNLSISEISVDEFLSQCLLMPKGFHYRGQGDKNWKLTPSAFRREDGSLIDPVDRSRRLKYFFDKDQFTTDYTRLVEMAGHKENVIPHSNAPGYQQLTQMAFFQHFGMPTPLLDWTASPLVALFMAFFERPRTALDVSIYRFDPNLKPTDVVFQPYDRIHFQRINSQLGGMMFFGDLNETAIQIHTHVYEEYITSIGPPRFITKLNIKIEIGDDTKIKDALQNNGFREDMLFPNTLQWIGRRIRERMSG